MGRDLGARAPSPAEGAGGDPGHRRLNPEQIRREARRERRSLDPERRRRADDAVRRHLTTLLSPRPAGRVALFLPVDGEVDLAPAAPVLRGLGWRTVLPVVTDGRRLTFGSWDAGTALRPNRYGVHEPVDSPEVPVTDLDVVVVPSVAVDGRGNRLGFGAGFYDRTLADRPARTLLVTTVHSVQVVPPLDPSPWDVPMDVVITEDGVRDAAAARSGGP